MQENQIQGTDFAFETILYGGDGKTPCGGLRRVVGQHLRNQQPLTITHYIDTESDLMHVYLNGEFLGQVPTTA